MQQCQRHTSTNTELLGLALPPPRHLRRSRETLHSVGRLVFVADIVYKAWVQLATWFEDRVRLCICFSNHSYSRSLVV